jgi:hypothetical protein
MSTFKENKPVYKGVKRFSNGNIETFKFVGKKAIIHLRDRACESADELLSSVLFYEVVSRFVKALKRRQSPLLLIFGKQSDTIQETDLHQLIRIFQVLAK